MNETGPFDRPGDTQASRDRSARMILIGMGVVGLVLLVLVLPPLSLLSSGGDKKAPSSGGDGQASQSARPASSTNSKAPKAPDGFEALSRSFNLEKPRGTEGPYALTVNLLQPLSDGRNLALYTNKNGKYERLASATLVNNGSAASGQVTEMPANVVVLRRTGSAVVVSGWLPAGAAPDPQALEVLAAINPVGLTPADNGSLAGAPAEVAATKGNVVPSVRAESQAEIDTVNSILASPPLRDAHIAALVELASKQGNAGVDVDYDRVALARKADYTAFISVLSDKLHAANKSLSITLPAPVRAGVSWDAGAYDWEELAKRADVIKLSADPDPSSYHKRVDEVLNYLKPKVDLRKVSLVVTRESYEKGTDGLRPLTLRDGLALASEIEVRNAAAITPNSSVVIVGKNIFQDDGASGLKWDEAAFAVSFSYPGRGGQRTVWLENAFSLAFRLDLARRFGLGGVTVDDVSLNPALPAFWETLRAYGETGNVALVQPNSVLLRPLWQVQSGGSEAGTKGNIVWRAPNQPGSYDVSLIVSDGIIRGVQKIVLTVGAASGTPVAGGTPTGTGTPRSGASTASTPLSQTAGSVATSTPRPGATTTPTPTR